MRGQIFQQGTSLEIRIRCSDTWIFYSCLRNMHSHYKFLFDADGPLWDHHPIVEVLQHDNQMVDKCETVICTWIMHMGRMPLKICKRLCYQVFFSWWFSVNLSQECLIHV